METEEFNELVKRSLLKNEDLCRLLGVSRVTIHNYKTGRKIPSTKADFIREVLDRTPEEIKELLGDGAQDISIEKLMPLSVKYFDELMSYQEFRNKVSIEAYDLATSIIEKKLNKRLIEGKGTE